MTCQLELARHVDAYLAIREAVGLTNTRHERGLRDFIAYARNVGRPMALRFERPLRSPGHGITHLRLAASGGEVIGSSSSAAFSTIWPQSFRGQKYRARASLPQAVGVGRMCSPTRR